MLFIPISPISVNSLNLLSKHTEFTFIEDTSVGLNALCMGRRLLVMGC